MTSVEHTECPTDNEQFSDALTWSQTPAANTNVSTVNTPTLFESTPQAAASDRLDEFFNKMLKMNEATQAHMIQMNEATQGEIAKLTDHMGKMNKTLTGFSKTVEVIFGKI